jgi:prepilin-type N-terminal cleavage/methylation domain-containing protein
MEKCRIKFGSHYRTPRPRAFTLVECLAVTSIITLLLSVLLPAMGRVRQQATKVMCQANLRSWSAVFAAYTTDNKNYFPLGTVNYNVDIETAHQAVWVGALKDYYQNPEMRRCPATIRVNTSDTVKAVWVYNAKKTGRFLSPEDYGSYGTNGWIDRIVRGINDLGHSNTASARAWQRMDTAKNMDKIPVMLDAVDFYALPEQDDEPPSSLRSIKSADQMARFCIPRHPSGTVNSLFMDSSVRSVGLKELWTLKWHRSYDASATQPNFKGWMASYKDYQ